jgi:hypothetical protein
MSYSFEATCTKNAQSSTGSHLATLQGATGETATVPSTDMLCVVGWKYKVTLEGEFAPKPKPVAAVKYAGPERRLATSSHVPPAGMTDRRHALEAKPFVLGSTAAKYSGPERRVKQVAIPAPGVERRHATA